MSKKKVIGSLMLGVAVGATAGVLFAPKEGKETRRELKKKMKELLDNAKSINMKDVSDLIEDKINDIREDLNDLDKEKILKIAKDKSKQIKNKCEDLVNLAVAKGTPVLQDAAIEVRDKTIDVMHGIINKLENIEIDKKNPKKDDK